MTREEAKELYTPKSTYPMKMRFIDKIYDDFESRTCEGCRYFQEGICYNTAVCLMNGGEYILIAKEFSCNKWEQK